MRNSNGSFERFVTDSGPALFRTASLLTGDPGEAEDLLQDALERVLRRWNRSTITDPDSYVRTTMVNLLRSRWRPRRVRMITVAEVPEQPSAGSTTLATSLSDRADLFMALRQITKKQRIIIVLRYWLDLSEVATAKTVGCSVGTVKSQSSRGLRNLRKLLDPVETAAIALGPNPTHAWTEPKHSN